MLPAAVGLRKQGASREATTSFLISTPETGVDSIAVTYALLDPLMTVIRPLAAVATAVAAGLAVGLTPESETPAPDPGCGCDKNTCGAGSAGQAPPAGSMQELAAPDPPKPPVFTRMGQGLAYAGGELMDDLGLWLGAGILVAGAISHFLPPEAIPAYLGSELGSMLVMLVVGIPLYVCATASTPVAAALALKGLSPGAALVFLLVGPATNAATLSVVGRTLGRYASLAYLGSLAVMSLGLGLAANRLYDWLGVSTESWSALGAEEDPGLFAELAGALVLALCIKALVVRLARRVRS